MARTGYTLPVFAVAAAKAALLRLQGDSTGIASVELDLLPERASVPVESVARLDEESALGVTRSDPGDNLDLTRNTPVWAWVRQLPRTSSSEAPVAPLTVEAGEGVGRTAEGVPAIYAYARRLFTENLLDLVPRDRAAVVRIILPQGRTLAQRTSNEAFGVLEGLSLLGTSGISEAHSAVEGLEAFRRELQAKAQLTSQLAFCIGHNGQRVAEGLGIEAIAIARAGNWLGALLVEAGLLGVESVLLVGYHGKLVKLAGGIFNTSSHIADGKLEILAATVAAICDDPACLRGVLAAETAEAAAEYLQCYGLARTTFDLVAQKASARARAYVRKYATADLKIGTILSDRQGEVVGSDETARALLANFRSSDEFK